MKLLTVTLASLTLSLPSLIYAGGGAPGPLPAKSATIPSPAGIYVVNKYYDLIPTAKVYAAGFQSSTAFQNDITGLAIYVPIAKILPSITTWGQFAWDWRYLDTLVQIAVSNGKKFSIALISGLQNGPSYLHSLPQGFVAGAGANSAPLFDVWIIGGEVGRCISSYILLPWVPRVQEFWSAAATALAAHLQQTGVYGSLTLVHVPGLLVYDEEIRLPANLPAPSVTDTLPCPDGRLPFNAVLSDADTSRWRQLGYSDTAAINGFGVIASAFAQAFPDRILGLSLLPRAAKITDFPNLSADTSGYVAAQLVKEVNTIAPGRIEVQADDLDVNVAQSDVIGYAARYSDILGWQENAKADSGAGCSGGPGSCDPDGPASPYFHLLQNGAHKGAIYLEVWPADVVKYPQSFAAARSAGFYTLTGVELAGPVGPAEFTLQQNYPNPFNPSTTIRYGLPSRAHVILSVSNALGQQVALLEDGEQEAGYHEVKFDGTDLASGVYFYRLQAGSYARSMKLLLLR